MGVTNELIELSMHLMPLMWREFQVRVSPQRMTADPAYAKCMVDLASASAEPRLARYAALLQLLLLRGAAGEAAPAAPAAAPGPANVALREQKTALQESQPAPVRCVKSLR